MKKSIKWTYNGQTFTGFASLENRTILFQNDEGEIFDRLKESEIKNRDIEKTYDDIPHDITEYKLK